MPATLHNALLVLVVQSLSTLFPFTPGGVGTQQGLLVYVFDRAGTGIAGALLLSFSIGMYIAVTIENIVIGFVALFLMIGTLRWRRVVPDEEEAYARGSVSAAPHPVRIVVTDDLALAADRLLPRLPRDPALHLGVPDRQPSRVVFVNWFILLFKGRTPDGLHEFVAGYIRYLTHLEAYFLLAANPFPPFYLVGSGTTTRSTSRSTRPSTRTGGRRSSGSSSRSRR